MKIVHEIRGPTQSTGGIRPYAKRIDEESACGAIVEWLITSDTVNYKNFWLQPENEEIHIEGDAYWIIKALRESADIIGTCVNNMVERNDVRSDWKENAEEIAEKHKI